MPDETGMTAPVNAAEVDWPLALERACSEPGFTHVNFQPVVDVRRGVVCGYELLTRFAGPPHESPEQWFRAAVEHGCAARLESRVLHEGLLAARRMPANCFLAVNLSPQALVSTEVCGVLAAHDRLDGIVIELTEQTAVLDPVELQKVLGAIRAAGGKIAVDDVGSAYAGLGQIMTVRPEFVKLDRQFVSGLDHDEGKAAMISSLGDLASRIDAWVVAEGVERVEELDALIRLGVPLTQGYLLGRPALEMNAVDAELGVHMRARSLVRLSEGGVGPLVEPAPIVRDHDGSAALVHLFFCDMRAEYAAVVDDRGRPLTVVGRVEFFRTGGSTTAPLLVERTSDVSEVARRAMTRPSGERFEPLVCCDEVGRYVGLVRVERLVEELAA